MIIISTNKSFEDYHIQLRTPGCAKNIQETINWHWSIFGTVSCIDRFTAHFWKCKSLFHEITEASAIYHACILWSPAICPDLGTLIWPKTYKYIVKYCLHHVGSIIIIKFKTTALSSAGTNLFPCKWLAWLMSLRHFMFFKDHGHNWQFSGTDLLPCDWVACLQPPQAPAYTNLRHTGWWVTDQQLNKKKSQREPKANLKTEA